MCISDDAYVQARYQRENGAVLQAKQALADARTTTGGSYKAITDAQGSLAIPTADEYDGYCQSNPSAGVCEAQGWRSACLQLYVGINASVGTNVVQGQVETMNIDKIDEPLSDAPWLLAQLEEISKLALEEERLSAIEGLLGWEDPGVGGWCEWPPPILSTASHPGETH